MISGHSHLRLKVNILLPQIVEMGAARNKSTLATVLWVLP